MPDKHFKAGLIACFLLFLGLSSIHLGSPWKFIHEDPGAVSTAFAVAHLKLGLSVTKGHDFRLNNVTGEAIPYAHHPPASGLLTALDFYLFDSRAPILARGGSLLFHFIFVILFTAFLRKHYSREETLMGLFCLSIIPMSTFFGRLVGPDPLVLPFMLVFVISYFGQLEQEEGFCKGSLAMMTASAFFGAFCGWPIFFAMLTCLFHSLSCWLHTRDSRSFKLSAYIAFLGLTFFAMDIAHIYWSSGKQGLEHLTTGLSSATQPGEEHPWWTIVGAVLEHCRRYFTEILFLAGLIYLYRTLRESIKGSTLRLIDHINLVFFFMGLMNILFFPSRARNHLYWPFFFLPFMVVSFLETLNWAKQKWPDHAKRITAACFALIVISSAYTLYIRHTRVSGYTLRAAEEFKIFF